MRALLAAVLLLPLVAAAPVAARELNVRDFASPQAAVDAAHDGDRVFFPAGEYVLPDSGLVVCKQLELAGEGIGRDGSGTVLRPASPTSHVIVLRTVGKRVPGYTRIRDLRITGTGQPAPAGAPPGHGIHCAMGPGSPGVAQQFVVERVVVTALAGDGVHWEGANLADDTIILSSLTDVQCVGNLGHGVYLRNAVLVSIVRGYMNGNGGCGLLASGVASLRLDQVAFQANQNRPRLDSVDREPQVVLHLCHGFTAIGCYFESFGPEPGRPRTTALVLDNCRGGIVQGSLFTLPAYDRTSRGLLITGGSTGITVGANTFDRVGVTVELARGAAGRDHVIFPQIALHPVPGDSLAYGLRTSGVRRKPPTLLQQFDGARFRPLK